MDAESSEYAPEPVPDHATVSWVRAQGDANGLPNEALGFPVNQKALLYKPDITENIELGIEGTLADNYQYTVALYDIQWDNLQSNLADERGLMGADSVDLWGSRANAIVSTPRTYSTTARYTF